MANIDLAEIILKCRSCGQRDSALYICHMCNRCYSCSLGCHFECDCGYGALSPGYEEKRRKHLEEIWERINREDL